MYVDKKDRKTDPSIIEKRNSKGFLKNGVILLKKYLKQLFFIFISLCESSKNKALFNDVQVYCMFIGYARSGHSLVGALLDAHPNIIIAYDLNTLLYVRLGFNKKQIGSLLLRRSKNIANHFRQKGAIPGDFDYRVPHQWQGKFCKLEVIGNKLGGISSLQLGSNPLLFDKLKQTLGVHIKYLHVYRNPYDNITTMFKKGKESLEKTVEIYFSHVEAVCKNRDRINVEDILDIQYEKFIHDPKNILEKICEFVGVKASLEYLDDCASIVYKLPHKSRYDIDWPPALINQVKEKINNYDFLCEYSYD